VPLAYWLCEAIYAKTPVNPVFMTGAIACLAKTEHFFTITARRAPSKECLPIKRGRAGRQDNAGDSRGQALRVAGFASLVEFLSQSAQQRYTAKGYNGLCAPVFVQIVIRLHTHFARQFIIRSMTIYASLKRQTFRKQLSVALRANPPIPMLSIREYGGCQIGQNADFFSIRYSKLVLLI
jgi:hypothetical protein